jgi:lysophospholipase L1-like esterase
MPQLTAPDDLPPGPFTGDGVLLAGSTLRQTVRVTVGGSAVRVRFANTFGRTALPITTAAVALPAGAAAVVPDSCRVLTFGGRRAVVVPPGAQFVSDPVDLPVGAGERLTISTYLASGQAGAELTGHPGSRTTSYLVKGDRHAAPDLPDAVGVEHWFLISGVEVPATGPAFVAVGDSLTDGRGSTTDGNDRWPDQLFDRNAGPAAVLNQAAGGNRVLDDGIGPGVLARLDRDVLAIGGVDRMLLFAGVNDIGTAADTPAAQRQVAADLLVAYRQVVERAHARDIRVYGATLTPFGGHDYDSPHREATRQTLNAALPGIFDGVADFDAAVRDPAHPSRLAAAYDTGDHLHLTPAGYHSLAHAVPLEWLA